MARQLVVCLDGTGNRFSHLPTNVVRLLRSLDADPSLVLAYYDQGVGTFGLKETLFEWQKLPSRICGLAFGWGLQRTVEGAYRFLAQNLAPGDEIFIFGFSRGAYAARALASMVHAVGLVPAHGTHLFDYAWSMLTAREGAEGKPDFRLQARFKASFGRPTRIRFLGVFDTVKSVGWVYDPVSIPYTAQNPDVDIVRHAVSIDERRCFFRQNLWTSSPSVRTDVRQVWFAGVHSDIGGGYPPEEAHLALIAHRWMLSEALRSGLRLDRIRCRKQLRPAPGIAAAFDAPMHDSMGAPWKVAEWLPQRAWRGESDARRWQIGAMPPFGQPRPRRMPGEALVHRSVEERLRSPIGYSPPNLPEQLQFVDDDPALGAFL